MPAAVVMADLPVSTDTREHSAGLSALEELRQTWLAAHRPARYAWWRLASGAAGGRGSQRSAYRRDGPEV